MAAGTVDQSTSGEEQGRDDAEHPEPALEEWAEPIAAADDELVHGVLHDPADQEGNSEGPEREHDLAGEGVVGAEGVEAEGGPEADEGDDGRPW
jgi:hypothetical protein